MAGGRRGKGVEIRRPREQNDKSQKKVELPHSLGRATMKNYPNSACFEKFLKEWKQHLPEANLARARAESRSRSLEPRRAPHLPRPQSELEPRGLAIRDNELITKFSVLQGRSVGRGAAGHALVGVGEDPRGRDTHSSELPSTPLRTLSIQLEPALARRTPPSRLCVRRTQSLRLASYRTEQSE